MLIISDVSVRLGDLLLFDNVNITINNGDRIGLVGPNGAGKSTLLRVITGDLEPDTGSVQVSAGIRIGHLRQGFADIPDGTLADILDFPTNGLFAAMREIEAASLMFDDATVDAETSSKRFQSATDRFEALGGYLMVSEVEALLDQFGLGDISLEREASELSGGQKTRAGLAGLLASRPDLLVLDEPTNHLDAAALKWLSQFLLDYQGAFIIVSHDRAFLDASVNEIVAIDPRNASVRTYVGNYSDYDRVRQQEAGEAAAAWHRQQVEVARIQRDIRSAEQKSRTIEKSTIDYAVRKKAAKIARPAVVRKKKLERMLDSTDAAERPERSWGLALDFGDPDTAARDVVKIEGISIAFGENTVLKDVSLIARYGERIAITGDNGSGKTTLIKAITGEVSPVHGAIRLGPGTKIGYLSQEQETLNPELTVLQQAQQAVSLSETELRNELHKFLFGGDTVHRLVGDMSYGERSRLLLALLVLQETTLLLLDEPLNHLDIDARDQFEQALLRFHGTILVVLHDRYSIDRLATHEWRVENGSVREIVLRTPRD